MARQVPNTLDGRAQEWVRILIQIEMKKRGLTYRDLAQKFTDFEMEENERNLRNKIARGTFSASFFLLCMLIMKVRILKLDEQFDVLTYKFDQENPDERKVDPE